MDKFTNYNGEDTYGNPNYDGYNPDGVYNDPEYTIPEYSDAQYNNAGYSNPEYYNPEYSNAEYSNTSYSDFENMNSEYDTLQYPDEEYSETMEYEDIPQEADATNQTSFNEESIFSPLYPEGYAPTPEPDNAFQPKPRRNDYANEELTEEELADIRRQKAAARRRKLAARERRRRERRKQAIIRCSILLVIVILLIVGLVMLISGLANHFEEKKKERELSEYYATSEITTEEPVAEIDPEITAKALPADRDAALTILQAQAENDSTMQSICDSAAAIPDILLQNLAVNPEMKDFTLNYPAMINIVFDGEFSVELEGTDMPLYLQFDQRWGYADYSTDIVGLRGAGPTALSMAYTYLQQDGSKNPIKIADYATEKGYLDEDGKTHWSLMTDGAEELGLKATELNVDKDAMIDALESGKVIICMVTDGDFTTDEHFIVIRDYKDGFFYINDPASTARSEVGWDFKRLRSQIHKMCALEADAESSTASEETSGGDSGDGTQDTTEDDSQDTGTTPAE